MKRNIFTLLELLIVIAIIAILLSMLLPSLSNARTVSKRAVCMSNLKQIYTAFNLFAKNSESLLPPGGRSLYSERRDNSISWDDRIAEYMGRELTEAEVLARELPDSNLNVLMCPEDTKHTRGGNYLIRSYNTNSWRQWTQQANFSPLTQLNKSSFGVIGQIRSRFLGQIVSGAETIMITEGWQGKAGLDWYSALAREFDLDSVVNFNLHKNGSKNFIMTDGHVMFKKNSYIFPDADVFDSK